MYTIVHRERESGEKRSLCLFQGEYMSAMEDQSLVADKSVQRTLRLLECAKPKEEDGGIVFQYEIGERKSLKSITEKGKIKREDFLNIMSVLVDALCDAKDYALENNILISSDFIYKGEVDVLLTCFPCDLDNDSTEEFRAFFVGLSPFIENKARDMYSEINTVLQDGKFEIRDIKRVVDHLSGVEAENVADSINTENEPVKVLPVRNGAKPSRPTNEAFVWEDSIPVESAEGSNGDEVGGKSNRTTGKQPKNDDAKKSIFGGLFKRSEDKKKAKLKTSAKDKKEPPKESDEVFAKTVFEQDDGLTKLSEIPAVAYLVEVGGDGGGRKISIERFPFVIGRAKNCNLVLTPSGVSRIHAEIRNKDSLFYLVDTGTDGKGSLGGTFINGEQISPMREEKIKTNDRLRFYQFELDFKVE